MDKQALFYSFVGACDAVVVLLAAFRERGKGGERTAHTTYVHTHVSRAIRVIGKEKAGA